MDQHHNRPEHNENQMSVSAQAKDTLSKLALTLYQCPDGSLVNHPRECKEGLNLKQLSFNNIFENLKS